MPLNPPVLSLIDPLVSSEGNVDPFSLQRAYERLADRVMPAVTVRMSRVRFVTAMCLGALVCQQYEDDALSIDKVTPPWLVFEWYVIEAFARLDEERTRAQGIAGLQKVRAAQNAQRPVSAQAYLKTPKVTGFSGIFRRYAVKSRFLGDDLRLDDGGWELLRAWEREQNLEGLIDGREGPGAELVRELRDAVKRGMTEGHTVKRSGEFWNQIVEHLDPSTIGKTEAAVLIEWLRKSAPLTREHLALLEAHGKWIDSEDEAEYLRGVRARCGSELAGHLAAIDAYEALCRPLSEGFDLIRHISTNRSCGPVGASDLASNAEATSLVDDIAKGCKRVVADPRLLDLAPDVRSLIDAFDSVRSVPELFAALIGYHELAQSQKPPDGKRSWVEHTRNNAVMLRTAYALPERPPPRAYVHDYRTMTLCRFLRDTGAFV